MPAVDNSQHRAISPRKSDLLRLLGWITALLLLSALVVTLLALYSPLGLLISSVLFGVPANPPLCHKQLLVPVVEDRQKNPLRELPNEMGLSDESFLAIGRVLGHDANWSKSWAAKYKYIPGLRQDDPGELVVFYLAKPTRWVWHGLPPKAWDPIGWVVCPLDQMVFNGLLERDRVRPGEKSETLTNEQFRERLQRTLDYLKANRRPHWEVVVKEYQATLDSLASH
jgi:hypothetical protein